MNTRKLTPEQMLQVIRRKTVIDTFKFGIEAGIGLAICIVILVLPLCL